MQMMQRVLEGAGAAYNLALGFIPDYVEIFKRHDTVNSSTLLRWWGPLYEDDPATDAADQEYGNIDTGGTLTEADADTGVQSYEGSKTPVVLVDSPKPGAGDVKCTPIRADKLIADTTNPTARSGSVCGTIVRPTTANGYVYECTTAAAAAMDAEPTWPTTPGEVVADGNSNYYTCREENIVNAGELGITIGKTLAANSQILFVNAFKADSAKNLGDVA